MGDHRSVISAFSEEQTERLTGVSRSQLRYWDQTDFYTPSYAERNRRLPFSRVYSFKDIVSLRVLHTLRNEHQISLQELRKVRDKLRKRGIETWIGVRLWVLNKSVVWQDPDTERPQNVVSKQYVVPMDLGAVVAETRNAVAAMTRPTERAFGIVERSRYINHNAPVIAGTRIPVSAIKRFATAGYSIDQILKEYPDLTDKDVKAALAYEPRAAA